jgi:hypothetical protein
MNWIIVVLWLYTYHNYVLTFVCPFYTGPWFAYSVTILCFINDFCGVILLSKCSCTPELGQPYMTADLNIVTNPYFLLLIYLFITIYSFIFCYIGCWWLTVWILILGSTDPTEILSWRRSACTRVVRCARPSVKHLVRVLFPPHLPSRDFPFIGKGWVHGSKRAAVPEGSTLPRLDTIKLATAGVPMQITARYRNVKCQMNFTYLFTAQSSSLVTLTPLRLWKGEFHIFWIGLDLRAYLLHGAESFLTSCLVCS